MEASNSEAYHRIVSRKLYSNKVVLSIVFAFVMVASAFVIAAHGKAVPGNVTPSLEGWRLLPAEMWSSGDIRGYHEGDFIPIELTLNRPNDGSDSVGARLGFEWGKNPDTDLIRGFKQVVSYDMDWTDANGQTGDPSYPNPDGPYSPGVVGDPLFYDEPDGSGVDKGVLVATPHTDFDDNPNPLKSDEYFTDQRLWIAWDLWFTFTGFDTSVEIYCGGELFRTTDTTKGASYYSGSSLHVRILGTWTEDGEGNLQYQRLAGGADDLPICAELWEILTPPSLYMTKSFDPTIRTPGRTSKVQFTIQNHGQADAYMLDLYDYLPLQLTYVPGTMRTWTSDDPGPPLLPNLGDYDPAYEGDADTDDPPDGIDDAGIYHWDFSDPLLSDYALVPGKLSTTGTWERYFSFDVQVNNDAITDWDPVNDLRRENAPEPITVTNKADLYYTDRLVGGADFPPAHAEATLTIVKVAVDIEKTAMAYDLDRMLHEIDCAAVNYDNDMDGVVEDNGDSIFYRITIWNTGTEEIVSFKVIDEILNPVDPHVIWYPHYDSGHGHYVDVGHESGGGSAIWPLHPGGSVYEDFPYTFENEMVDPWENTASVKEIHDAAGHTGASEDDDASVNLLHPAASITKVADREMAAWYDDLDPEADQWVGEGEVIKYTITVTNLDDETHVDFVVCDSNMFMLYFTDPAHPEDTFYLTGDDAWTGTLEPKGDIDGKDTATLTLYHTLTYEESLSDTLENTVYFMAGQLDPREGTYAYCVDDQHERCWGVYPLYGESTETVTIVHPAIEITKVAVDGSGVELLDPKSVGESGIVRYKITVDNTGDVGLWWFYWDDLGKASDWTPLTSGALFLFGAPHPIGGSWSVEAGEYVAEIPATDPAVQTMAIAVHDTFEGYNLEFEATITSTTQYWRSALWLRYSESPSGISGYFITLWGAGAEVDEVVDNVWAYHVLGSTPVSPGTHNFKVRVYDTVPGGPAEIWIDIDNAGWYLAYTDYTPRTGNRIGLMGFSAWGYAEEVHFDDVYVREIIDGVVGDLVLEDHFSGPGLIPDDPDHYVLTWDPEFADPPGIPAELEDYFNDRIASGYLEPDDPPDVRYFTYEVQEDDPNPLENHVYVYGWHTSDGTKDADIDHPEDYVSGMGQESVAIRGWIYGYVYYDPDLDDVQMETDIGDEDSALDGWTVHLYKWNDGLSDWEWVRSVDTGPSVENPSWENGYYLFDMLAPGEYRVQMDLSTHGDYFSTNPKQKEPDYTPSDPEYDPDGVYEEVSVVAGLGGREDLGAAKYSYIEGWKWLDVDVDGERDQPDYAHWEPYLNGWHIHCDGWTWEDVMVDPDTGELTTPTVQLELISGSDGIAGHYKFKVEPGTYYLWEELPADWFQTYPWNHHEYPPSTDPKLYPAKHDDIDIGEDVKLSNKDFGNVPLIKIWGVKFFDKNMNGLLDFIDEDRDQEWDPGEETEPLLNGWTMKLWRLNPDTDQYYKYPGYPHADDQMQYVTKKVGDLDGYYEFVVPVGVYKIEEVIDTDLWEMTTDPSTMEGLDAGYPVHDWLNQPPEYWLQWPLMTPKTVDPVPVGNMRYASIVGYKFIDLYGGTEGNPTWPNGIMDGGEVGSPYWTIHCTPDGESELPSVLTSDGYDGHDLGWYEFEKLLPGTYEVKEDYGDWLPTTPWKVFVNIPAILLTDPIVIRVDFGNAEPTADPTVCFLVQAGWNLWSSPVTIAGFTAKGLLNAIGPSGLIVTKIDKSGEYVSYVANTPTPDFAIEYGDGVYVYATQKTQFVLVGDAVSNFQKPLVAGWNLVGISQIESLKASQLLAKVTGCNGLIVTSLDPFTGEYKSYVKGTPTPDFWVTTGKAYFVWVDGPGTLVFS